MVVALVCAWWSYVTRARAWATPGFSQSQKIPSNMAPLFHSPTSPSSPKSTVWPKAAELSLSAFLSSITWAPFRLYLYKPSTFALLSLQDSLGGGFDSSQALVGELSQVGLWDRVLSSSQVASLARCSRVTQGSCCPPPPPQRPTSAPPLLPGNQSSPSDCFLAWVWWDVSSSCSAVQSVQQEPLSPHWVWGGVCLFPVLTWVLLIRRHGTSAMLFLTCYFWFD